MVSSYRFYNGIFLYKCIYTLHVLCKSLCFKLSRDPLHTVLALPWNSKHQSFLTSYLHILDFLFWYWLSVKFLGKSDREEKRESSLWPPGGRRWSVIKIQSRRELHCWGEREEEAMRWTHCIVVALELNLSVSLCCLRILVCFFFFLLLLWAVEEIQCKVSLSMLSVENVQIV